MTEEIIRRKKSSIQPPLFRSKLPLYVMVWEQIDEQTAVLKHFWSNQEEWPAIENIFVGPLHIQMVIEGKMRFIADHAFYSKSLVDRIDQATWEIMDLPKQYVTHVIYEPIGRTQTREFTVFHRDNESSPWQEHLFTHPEVDEYFDFDYYVVSCNDMHVEMRPLNNLNYEVAMAVGQGFLDYTELHPWINKKAQSL